jgi:hypothetical protein
VALCIASSHPPRHPRDCEVNVLGRGQGELERLAVAEAVVERSLVERLRFKAAGVYGVSFGSSFAAAPPTAGGKMEGHALLQFECDPARAEELAEAATAQVRAAASLAQRLGQPLGFL